jgi:hypothetical protein
MYTLKGSLDKMKIADIDRLELDIIKAIEGGCQKRELKTNDSSKKIVYPKASNNNCFFKCIQPLVPQLREKVWNAIRFERSLHWRIIA